MGNSLRCCLACILPCGALDLIRIVHLNGYVEELTGRVTAGEVLKNYPDHVLSKPSAAAVSRRILIVAPDSDLKRGSIYFLLPSSSLPAHDRSKHKYSSSKQRVVTMAAAEKKRRRRKVTAVEWQPNLDSISEDL
ncbi:hypothetical protein C2S53_008616 [Perilla frutescens var. hirtella]|uniref:6,7-dimethyl-8-ribityllumazine synthase n=1 Tax=Perilla frutescens var. hirtella TaxID=608512 RepID=A0AAD4PE23_PERFH|nr:hypothetical protein C2S53_008616 [Perilla frutescens var. hirtella]